MQLNEPRDLRGALATASCTLLAAVPGGARAAGLDKWEIDSAVLHYSETDRVQIVEPVIFARRTFGEDAVNLRIIADSMTGASPNGATPTDKPQTFTSPSGNETYSVAAGELPMRSFSDQRIAVSAEWEHTIHRMRRGIFGVNGSSETDYYSGGLSYTLNQDFNNRLTTLSLGGSLNYDEVRPKGGAPRGLQPLSAATTVTTFAGEDDDDGEGGGNPKYLTDWLVGVTQVLSRQTLVQFNYSYGYANGYLTDPYKVVSVIDPGTGDTLDYLYEKRPDVRNKQSVYWKLVHHFGKDVAHVSYRYYWDDWDIRAHTADLRYRWELSSRHYLQPHLRYYRQSGATFYHHSVLNGEVSQLAYASADSRLAAFSGYTAGFRYGMKVGKKGEFSLRAEYLLQGGDGAGDAVGVQRQYDLYPDLEAVILQVGYTMSF